MSLSRAVLNSLLPEGAFWTPAAQSDYDLLLEGIADNTEEVYQVLKSLACIRCPETTTLLEDLEKEYGIIPATLATEAERRSRLKAFIYRRAGTGAWDLLQSKLREAGFDDVYVHPNDPAVDPANFYDLVNVIGGELIVNKIATTIDFDIPTDSGYWPSIFFVGGAATRDANGYITAIAYAGISATRRNDLKKIILTYKPLHTWYVFVDTYVDYLDGDEYLDGSYYLDGFKTEV